VQQMLPRFGGTAVLQQARRADRSDCLQGQ